MVREQKLQVKEKGETYGSQVLAHSQKKQTCVLLSKADVMAL